MTRSTSDEPPEFIHRIGGSSIENLRMKPREATLDIPGISVIRAATPADAARELRAGLPRARGLHQQARTIGTATVDAVRAAGFDVIPAPSVALPNHHRLIHPEGVAGFTDANLARLACRGVLGLDGGGIMNGQHVRLVDRSGNPLAGAHVVDEGSHFGGTVDLRMMPAPVRSLFEEFEGVVNEQAFTFLDELQGRIAALSARVVFGDGTSAPVADLQVFPGAGELSFRLGGPPDLGPASARADDQARQAAAVESIPG